MNRRRLAAALALALGLLAVMEVAIAVSLAVAHRSYFVPLVCLTAFLPASVPVVLLLWTGRSKSCARR